MYAPTCATGPDGAFLLEGLLAGWCDVQVSAEGYYVADRSVASGDADARFTLKRPAHISGIVVTPDGAPAAGASVWVGDYWPSAYADELGRFELEADPDGRDLHASLGKDLDVSTELVLLEGGATAVRLVLERMRSFVRLRVVDAEGNAIGGIVHGQEPTEEDGVKTVAFREPPGAEVELTVGASGHIDTSVSTVTYATAETAPVVEVAPPEGVLVRFLVRAPGGQPLDDAEIRFDGGDTRDTSDGSYLDPGTTYDIRIGAHGFLAHTIEEFTPPAAGTTLDVTLRPCASIRGRAVDPLGAPLSRVWAFFRDERAGGVDCEPDGSFLFESVDEARGRLYMGGDAGEALVEVETLSGRVTDIGTITLAPRVELRGRITDPASRPLGGAVVTLESPAPQEYGRVFAYADGTFRIRVPSVAGCHLVVFKWGWGTVRVPLEPGPARTLDDIVLAEAGAVEFDADAFDDIDLLSPTGVPLSWNGRRVQSLAPGRYIARLTRGETTVEREILVIAGETTVVDAVDTVTGR